MAAALTDDPVLANLNAQQVEAVTHGNSPLLIVAGAGSGKTRTLVHRVAWQIQHGIAPGRILLLTFTRRAAGEMLRRVDGLLRHVGSGRPGTTIAARKTWGGTFHAVAARLLRTYGKAIGLDQAFTIHDRSDSEDLLDVIRTELGLSKNTRRFPRKGTCMAIYSMCVNSQRPVEEILAQHYPWCDEFAADLKKLFRAYVERKELSSVLDYDDLLLYWQELLAEPRAGERIRSRFERVLVDEYQDTNRLQAQILKLLRPDGIGLTAVGDDAQSIYSFRAATVRNILDFPKDFPDTRVIKLEQNYRSRGPILECTNRVIAQSQERYAKELWSVRSGGEKPWLVTCHDEDEQASFLIRKILAHREAGIDLRRQAVLFRTSHHSILLETELARHNIPFVKYGGLKFVEAAHVKDLMAILRLAENPRDIVAGSRVLTLLPGIGPAKARQLMDVLHHADGDFDAWSDVKPPAAAGEQWKALCQLLRRLRKVPEPDVPAQVQAARTFYAPILEERYDNSQPRIRDLEQLEQLAHRFRNRAGMLAEITLDPPVTASDLAGEPLLDEDYLILSTIHSAKGLEWDSVYVIHAADGNIPSDMATGSPEQIEEELRLFYVALTRAKDWLYVCFPQRCFHYNRGPKADQHGFVQLTRFISESVQREFLCVTADATEEGQLPRRPASARSRLKAMWS